MILTRACRRVCWSHAAVFMVPAIPGVAAGTALGNALSGGAVLVGFAVVVLLAAIAMWQRAGTEPASQPAPVQPACPPLRVTRGVASGALLGLATGLFGVGGGFLIVPTLAIFLAFSMRLAVGTSLLIIAGTSAMALRLAAATRAAAR